MLGFFIGLFSFLLLLLCLFVVLIILMQKPSANAGMGAALGGGAAEQVFGGEAGNVLTKTTVYVIIAFFIICFGLYLATVSSSGLSEAEMTELETLRLLREGAAAEDADGEEGGVAPGPIHLREEDLPVESGDAGEAMDAAPGAVDADAETDEVDLGAALGVPAENSGEPEASPRPSGD